MLILLFELQTPSLCLAFTPLLSSLLFTSRAESRVDVSRGTGGHRGWGRGGQRGLVLFILIECIVTKSLNNTDCRVFDKLPATVLYECGIELTQLYSCSLLNGWTTSRIRAIWRYLAAHRVGPNKCEPSRPPPALLQPAVCDMATCLLW